MNIPINLDLGQLDCWPLNGFAPGGYVTESCCDCSKKFIGDRRAYRCLECAIKSIVKRVEKSESDVQGMAEELVIADTIVANPKERIIAAAVYHGCTFSLPPPARHGHILATMHASLGIETIIPPENQGFLTNKGRFVNRVEGKLIAYQAKQIIQHSAGEHCPELYSEDVW